MRNAALIVALGALALALGGCLDDPPQRPADQWPIAREELARVAAQGASAAPSGPGEAAYRKTCIACHGADGRGNGGKTAADFTSPIGVLKKPDGVLLVSIRDGVTGAIGVMPPHGTLLKEDELAAVLGYVRQTFGPNITPEAVDALPDAATAPEPQ